MIRLLKSHKVVFTVVLAPLTILILSLRSSVDNRLDRPPSVVVTSTNGFTGPQPSLVFGHEAKKAIVTDLSSSAPASVVKTVVHNKTTLSGTAKETTTTPESQGHIFIYSSLEEQTNGARNLWQLEMWANQINMKVAEPFAVNSLLGAMGAIPDFNKALRFGDYFDKDKWNKMVKQYNGSPLIEWETFLPTAPHQAIILYTLINTEKDSKGIGLNITYGEDDIKKYRPGRKREQIADDDMIWIKKHFNITRVVTFIHNINSNNPLTLEKLSSRIFGDLKPNQVTLICVNWIGIGVKRYRIQIVSAPASFLNSLNVEFRLSANSYAVSPVMSPSQKVLEAYKNYVTRYIGDRKYIATVFRTFTTMYYYKNLDFAVRRKNLLQCSKLLKNELNKVRNKWKIFLTYDLETFGSGEYSYFNSTHSKEIIHIRNQILSDVYGSNGSPEVKQRIRDERLMKAAGGITDRGFIAILEKTIATQADCIVLLGVVSSFVRSSASTYISLHKTNPCVVSICSEHFLDATGKKVSTNYIPARFLHGVRTRHF